MADLSGVLRKTIDGLPRATPQLREKVYEKARAAIKRQIDAANPPLAEGVVSARVAALEDAISRTEEHYVSQEADAASQEDEAAPAPVAPVPSPAAQTPAPPPKPAQQPAVPPRAPPAAPAPATTTGAAPAVQPPQSAPPQRPAQPPQAPQPPQPPRQMPATGDDQVQPVPAKPAAPAAAPPAQPQRPAAPPAAAPPRPQQQPPQVRPTLPAATIPGAAPSDTDGRPAAPFFPPATVEPDAGDLPPAIGAPFIVPKDRTDAGAPIVEARQRNEPSESSGSDSRIPHDIRVDDGDIPEADVTAPRYPTRRPKRSGSGGKVAAALVVVLLLGGAGAAGWVYRDELEALLVTPADIGTIAEQSGSGDALPESSNSSGTGDDQSTEVATAEPEPESTRRFTQRILPDGTEVDEGPAKKTPNAFDEGTNVAAATDVDPNAPAAGAIPTISSEIGENPSLVGGETPGQSPATSEPAAEAPVVPAESTPPAAGETSGQLEVGQKAVFYQEKTEDLPGTQENGTAVWSVVDEPGTDGQAGEPAIRAVVDVPDEKMKLTMTIKRNSDPTLPASHVIELEFAVPQDFPGGSVANVQRLAMKETEQARGEPLIGVAGKISDNYFIIALNNLDQAVQNNLALLQNLKWIDIPIAYSNGRRALVSIEKGIPGDRIFKEALDAWKEKT